MSRMVVVLVASLLILTACSSASATVAPTSVPASVPLATSAPSPATPSPVLAPATSTTEPTSPLPTRTQTSVPPTATRVPLEVGKNLVGNPSFEQDPRTTETAWVIDARKTDLQADWGTGTVRSGTRALALKTSSLSGQSFAVPGWYSKPIPIADDGIYVFNVWAFTADGAVPQISVDFLGSKDQNLGGLLAIGACKQDSLKPGKWTPFSMTISASQAPGATQVRLGLTHCVYWTDGKATTLFYDDVFFGALSQVSASKAAAAMTTSASTVAMPTRLASAPRLTATFPRQNVYGRALPSVVWCGDTAEKVTVEAHFVGRTDVAKAVLADYYDSVLVPLYDDGTHGDTTAGDNIFTASSIQIPCDPRSVFQNGLPISYWMGYLRVTLKDGKELERGLTDTDNPFVTIGVVDPRFKNVFKVKDLGNRMTATAYAFFIQDSDDQIVDHYPVVKSGHVAPFPNATRKLYSVLPDAFDFVMVTTGEQLMSADGFWQNDAICGFNVTASNSVKNIGIAPFTKAGEYGSGGKLKSAVWMTLNRLGIFEHELAHTWGAFTAPSLGLSDEDHHWSSLSDVGGVLQVGSANGGFWAPLSPLELYLTGLVPPSQVSPLHVFDPGSSTIKTVTIDDVAKANGGARDPSTATAQKDFALALVVTQEKSYNDAAYAFFSLVSMWVTSRESPPPDSLYPIYMRGRTQFPAPFYWSTGGRATLSSKLPVDLPDVAGSPFK